MYSYFSRDDMFIIEISWRLFLSVIAVRSYLLIVYFVLYCIDFAEEEHLVKLEPVRIRTVLYAIILMFYGLMKRFLTYMAFGRRAEESFPLYLHLKTKLWPMAKKVDTIARRLIRVRQGAAVCTISTLIVISTHSEIWTALTK